MMLKGLTVQYLFHRTSPLNAGDTVLFHAAAGGVGLIACQWARSEGIRLIGTAGTDEKCALAREHGATDCINYRTEDFVARVRELTENFFVEWLRLRELWSAQPDSRRFAAFYEGPKGKRTLAADMFCAMRLRRPITLIVSSLRVAPAGAKPPPAL